MQAFVIALWICDSLEMPGWIKRGRKMQKGKDMAVTASWS